MLSNVDLYEVSTNRSKAVSDVVDAAGFVKKQWTSPRCDVFETQATSGGKTAFQPFESTNLSVALGAS